MSSEWKKRFGFRGAMLTVGMVVGSAVPALALAHGGAGDQQTQYDKDKDKDKGTGGSGGHDDGKKKVCHKGKTIEVGAPAVDAHLRHGDKKGPCPHGGYDHDQKDY